MMEQGDGIGLSPKDKMLTDIATMKARRATRHNKRKAWYSDNQKLEAVKLWLMTGNLRGTAAALNIPYYTVKEWRYTKWWEELVIEMRTEGSFQLSNKLKDAAAKAIDASIDRLENGNWVFDQKKSELVRKPVNLTDAVYMANTFLDRQKQLEEAPIEEANTLKVQDRLNALARSFAMFASKTSRVEVIDAPDSGQTYEAVTFQGGQEPQGDGSQATEQDGSDEGERTDGEG